MPVAPIKIGDYDLIGLQVLVRRSFVPEPPPNAMRGRLKGWRGCRSHRQLRAVCPMKSHRPCAMAQGAKPSREPVDAASHGAREVRFRESNQGYRTQCCGAD